MKDFKFFEPIIRPKSCRPWHDLGDAKTGVHCFRSLLRKFHDSAKGEGIRALLWRNNPDARRQDVCEASGAGRVQRGGRSAPSLENEGQKFDFHLSIF